jgi:hypothetical protein
MPAINVMTHAKLLSGGGIVPDGEAQAFFDSARYDSGIGFGHTLFAGDRFPENGRGPNVIYGVRLRPEDMRFDDAAVRSVRIYVAACISTNSHLILGAAIKPAPSSPWKGHRAPRSMPAMASTLR